MLSMMADWIFLAVFFALLAIVEFSSRGIFAQSVAAMEPEERSHAEIKGRLITVGWYTLVGATTVAYLLGSTVGEYAMGFLFIAVAVAAALGLVSWIGRLASWIGRPR